MKPEAINLKKIKIRYKNLGRERALAQTWKDRNNNIIEFDKRLTEKEFLNCSIHECLHCILPDTNELDINKIANGIAKFLWFLDYRRVVLEKERKRGKRK